MPYRFRHKDATIEKAVRRIAREQLDTALAEIDAPQSDVNESIHQVRKSAKKLRGLIRLVRFSFPDYAHENAAIRDAARMLSGLRDRKGMVETCDKLIAAAGDGRAGAEIAPIRSWLDDAAGAAPASGDFGDRLAAFRADLAACRDRVNHWKIRGSGFGALGAGLEKSYARGHSAMAAFELSPTDANVHEWRKRVKYHWYHTRLLSPIWPDPMAARARAARDLGELLGDLHDLTVLQTYLAESADRPAGKKANERFEKRAERRKAELAVEALGLGRRLYAEPADRLSHRWRSCWKAWRAEQA